MFRKPKLNGLNGMACKEKWMDGRFIYNFLGVYEKIKIQSGVTFVWIFVYFLLFNTDEFPDYFDSHFFKKKSF